MTDLQMLYLIWNVVVSLVYAIDKLRAKSGGRRIRERTLIALAYLLGGVGAMFGMVLFNHKTSKMKFRIFVPLSVILNLIICRFLVLNWDKIF